MEITTEFANTELEEQGVWVDYRDDSKLKLARFGSKRFRRLWDQKMAPYRAQERSGRLSEERQTELLCEAMSEAILLDWSGFTNNGKEFKFSTERGLEMLRASIDFRNDVASLSATEEVFKTQQVADAVKN